MSNQKMVPWDIVIEILNKFQANYPGLSSERANKYVNDEIYEWFNEQPPEEERVYTGTGSDYLDCVLGVGGFEQYGPIDKEQTKEVDKLHPSWNDPDRGWI